MNKPPLGDLELEVLHFVSDHSPCLVREAADQFADPRGLARTTVLTVMERLRKKGYLVRHKAGGAFAYSPSQPKAEVMQQVVKDFVEKTLGGSLTPFVAYLATQDANLTSGEIDKLKELVEGMDYES